MIDSALCIKNTSICIMTCGYFVIITSDKMTAKEALIKIQRWNIERLPTKSIKKEAEMPVFSRLHGVLNALG